MVSLREAAERRAEAADGKQVEWRDAPSGVTQRRSAPIKAEMRAAETEKDGKQFLEIGGMASVYERG